MKTFYPPHWNNRPISVNITKEYITFHFPNEENREFYYMPSKEWIRDTTERLDRQDNWHKHMARKVWFISPMRKYINESLGIKDSGEPSRYDTLTEKDIAFKERIKENGGFVSISDMQEIYGNLYDEND